MEIIIQPTPQHASEVAAKIVSDLIIREKRPVLGLPTGNTPLQLYNELIKMHKRGKLDSSNVITFNLDEYVGLSSDHSGSYHRYMHDNFFRHINIREENINIPDGMTKNIPEHCREYEEAIRAAGGIDMQILGIGKDGHIAFNEPSSSLSSRTRIKTLTPQTRADNAGSFKSTDDVPHHVITMGLGTIMEANVCLLLAFGKQKAEAIARSIEGPITAMVPASVLQLHSHSIIVIDEAAAAKLKRTEYYKWVYDNKPEWQRI